MKVIQIIRNFSSGGAERFVIDLSNQLIALGHEVIILRFFGQAKFNALESELSDKIRIETISKVNGFDIRLVPKIYKFLSKEQPDIVNTHLSAFVYTTFSFLRCKDIAFFHTLHNVPEKESKGALPALLRRFFFRRNVVTPIALAKELQIATLKYYGLSDMPLIYTARKRTNKSDHFEYVNKYVNSLRDAPNTKIVVNVANYKHQKNQELLINTIKKLNEEGFNLKLLIVGGNKSSKRFSELSEISDGDIFFIGTVNNVHDYLYASDIFSLSSLWEATNIALIEALSVGCVPVCTPAGGIASMIEDGKNGFLSSSFSEVDFINAFKRCLNCTPNELSSISKNAIDSYNEKYTIEVFTEKHLQLYQSKLTKVH